MTSPVRQTLAVLLLCAIGHVNAAAQTPYWTLSETFPIDPKSVAMSASGRHVALLTSTPLLPEDDSPYGRDLYVYDIESAAWSWVPNSALYPHIAHALELVGLSDDGRYVGYAAVTPAEQPYAGLWRYDRSTGTVDTVVDFSTGGSGESAGTHVAMSRDGWTFAWMQRLFNPAIPDPLHLTVQRLGGAAPFRTQPCFDLPGSTAPLCTVVPALSADGSHVVYRAGGYYQSPGLSTASIDGSSRIDRPDLLPLDPIGPLAASGDLRFLVLPAASGSRGVVDTSTGVLDPLPVSGAPIIPVRVTDDGALVLAQRMDGSGSTVLYDRQTGLAADVGTGQRPLAISAEGRVVLTLGPFDAPNTLTLWALDHDGDGMLDAWESFFGLEPTDSSDAATDANGDGVSNLEAYQQRHHPTAPPHARRLFAEGATGFFDTTISLFNPQAAPATVVVELLGADAEPGRRVVRLGPFGRTDVRVATVAPFTATEFSVLIDTDRPIVAERRMQWPAAAPYAAHASRGAVSPSDVWYFAEGATVVGLQTFYLLQNPDEQTVDVTLRYLLQRGGEVQRLLTVPPRSRTTVWANQEPSLANAEFAAVVTSTGPIVAERAMYRDVGDEFFAAGTNAMGVTAPAAVWRFAEGAVGPWFDTFLTLLNPADHDTTVRVAYTPEGAPPFTQALVVPAASRATVWVDQADVLEGVTAVGMTVEADTPVVVERVMWWPGSSETWREGHVEVGTTVTASRFAIADGELNSETQTDTFLLVTTADGDDPVAVRVTAYPTDGVPLVHEAVVTDGRLTVWVAAVFPALNGQRFAAMVEALDGPGGRPEIVVEKAIYRAGLRSGASAAATPLPE